MSAIPKDREVLISTEYGVKIATWDEFSGKFIYANPQKDIRGGLFFGTNYVVEEDILFWREL